MIKQIPTNILDILDILHTHKEEAYLVGGCVRDLLMKRDVHDYDITTSCLPTRMIELFSSKGYSCIPTGLQHGTITILHEQQAIELTTYRIETHYEDHRSPQQVTFTRSLLEDLKRRDFTMNAIALSRDGTLIDPFNGIQDIQKKRITCVGDPKKRLEEDALRILRAIRFHCTLNFEIEEETINAIQQLAATLSYISSERIKDELNKLLMGDQDNTLLLLRNMKVLPYILQDFTPLYDHEQKTPWHCYDIFTHTDVALNHTKGYPLESKLAIIFHDIGKIACESFDEFGIAHYKKHALVSERMAIKQLRNLKYDKKTIQKVAKLILYHDYYVQPNRKVLRRFASKFDNDIPFALQALDIQLADDMAKNLDKSLEKIEIIKIAKEMLCTMDLEKDLLSIKDLAINGHDLLALGYQGKEIGILLQSLYDYAIEDLTRNTKTQLQTYLENYVKEKS